VPAASTEVLAVGELPARVVEAWGMRVQDLSGQAEDPRPRRGAPQQLVRPAATFLTWHLAQRFRHEAPRDRAVACRGETSPGPD